MSRARRASPAATLAALSLGAGAACVPDAWVTVSSTQTPRDAAAEAPDVAEAPDAAEDSDAGRCGASGDDSGACPEGQMRCDGACVTGPQAVYRGEGPGCATAGEGPVDDEAVDHAEGRWGRAYSFGGDLRPSWVALPPSVGAFGGGDFTLTLWFNTAFTGGVQSIISNRLACWTSTAFTGEDLRIAHNGRLYAEVWTTARLHAVGSATGFNDGRWHHVALVREGRALRLVVDAVVQETVPIGGSLNAPAVAPTYLGVGRCVMGAPGSNGTHDDTHWFDGLIDDVGFYARALSDAELAAALQGRCAR